MAEDKTKQTKAKPKTKTAANPSAAAKKKATAGKKNSARKTQTPLAAKSKIGVNKKALKVPRSEKDAAKETAQVYEETALAPVAATDASIDTSKEDKEAEEWLEDRLAKLSGKQIKTADEDEIDPEAAARGDTPMSVVAHLGEFRRRIMTILGLFIVFMVAAFMFSDQIIGFINKPFEETGFKLNMFKILGGFFIRLKASALAALMLIIPVMMYHTWRFIAPAMEKPARRFTMFSLLAATLLFYAGVAFVLFLLVPFVVPIMTDFIPDDMLTTIGADDYMSFVMMFGIAMGILFEMPIAVLTLTRIGVLTPQFLVSKRKVAIVVNFIIGGIVTPQDPLSMFFVALPLMILYEVSILLSKFVTKRMEKQAQREMQELAKA